MCRSIARVCDLEVREIGEGDVAGVGLPEGMRQVETRDFGCVWVVEALWERFRIGEEVRALERENGGGVGYEGALFAMTANRLCEPESKLGVWERWLGRVYLPSCWGVGLGQMYKAMDLLYENGERVEKAVFSRVADLFNVEVDVVFYDTTTCSFSVDEEDEEGGIRRFGHSKEGGWQVEVKVALAVTREGLPVRSFVFPGHVSDVETVEGVKRELRGWKLGRALFVADSGMNSLANRRGRIFWPVVLGL